MSLVLTGFMGSGKSTIGSLLSYRVRLPYIDTDKQIEEQQGISISEIFAIKGEPFFRNLETEYLKQLVFKNEKLVLSTGGGIPIFKKNRELLHQVGLVIYLRASSETIYNRLKDDRTRPLLNCDDPLTRIKHLLDEREPFYLAGADKVIETDGMSIEEIITNILEVYRK